MVKKKSIISSNIFDIMHQSPFFSNRKSRRSSGHGHASVECWRSPRKNW